MPAGFGSYRKAAGEESAFKIAFDGYLNPPRVGFDSVRSRIRAPLARFSSRRRDSGFR